MTKTANDFDDSRICYLADRIEIFYQTSDTRLVQMTGDGDGIDYCL